MANALGQYSSEGVRIGILLLMINAAVLGTTAISLSSAWAYGEVRGWPHSLQLPFKQAKGFYVTYVTYVGLAATIVLIPRALLQLIILSVQVLAGIMLPSAMIFLQLLLNDRELLDEQYVNKPWEQLGELDDRHRPLRPLTYPGDASRCPEPVSVNVETKLLVEVNMHFMPVTMDVKLNEIPENHYVVVHPLDDAPEEKWIPRFWCRWP